MSFIWKSGHLHKKTILSESFRKFILAKNSSESCIGSSEKKTIGQLGFKTSAFKEKSSRNVPKSAKQKKNKNKTQFGHTGAIRTSHFEDLAAFN